MKQGELLSRSSLRVSAQWVQWLNHNLDSLDYSDPQERLLRDSSIVAMHNVLNCARRLRGNPGWDMSGTMRDDTVNLHEEMLAALKTWKDNAPKAESRPSKLVPLYDLIEGVLNNQVRLAREIQEMREEGALSLSVTTDRQTKRIIETLH